jgi:F0F1-type ATP synthase membrane subunit b/b'
MEATLQALGALLVQAIPTIVLVVLLHFYLKAVFFSPLARTLQKRREATEGARELAEASMKRAAGKSAEYEAALQQARSEIYRQQEEARRKWLDDQSRQVDEARKQAHEAIHGAAGAIEAQAAAARRDLESQSPELAEQISRQVLEGRA